MTLVEVTRTATILKPHSPPPSPTQPRQLNSPSFTSTRQPNCDAHVPLTIFDRAAFDLNVIMLYAFRPPMPDNNALKEGLGKALSYFPDLAGRLISHKGIHPHIILNGAGIRLIETKFSSTLEELLPLDQSLELNCFYSALNDAEEIHVVQLNRFSCGGVIVATNTTHRVADGYSMSLFMSTWARLVRSLEDDINCFPYHDRSTIFVPRSPLRCDFDHYKNEFSRTPQHPSTSRPVKRITLHFSPEFIDKLKAKVNGTNAGRRCTTFRAILTHMWKRVTEIRGLQDEEVTRVRVAVNGRERLRPSVPMEYFGNLVLWAYPTLTVKEVLEESYGYVADEIEKAVAEIDESYFRSFIDFGEILKKEGKDDLTRGVPQAKSMYPYIEVNSLLGFKFHEVNFGTGPLCSFMPPKAVEEGLLIFMPSCEKSGGVDVSVGVFQDQADMYRLRSHDLE